MTLTASGIVLSLGRILASPNISLDQSDLMVVEALRRSTTILHNADTHDVVDYLRTYEPEQLPGLINNVKGILHELLFVEAENADGDSIVASVFPTTNHPDYDVELQDADTGQIWPMQLKATDSTSYVNETIDELGAGHVIVTSELADKLSVHSSGLSNSEITQDVHRFVDAAIGVKAAPQQDAPIDATAFEQADTLDDFLDLLPMVGAAACGLTLLSLWRARKYGSLSVEEFQARIVTTLSRRAARSVVATLPGGALLLGADTLYRASKRTSTDVG